MKISVLIFLLLISIESNGYNGSPNRNRYMTTNGHWVVQKNPENSGYVTVKYYDNRSNLLHSEFIAHRTQNILNNKLKRKLNKKLNLILLNESDKD